MTRSAGLLLATLALVGCGYRPVREGIAPGRLAVVLSSASVPDAAASDEVLVGVREALARGDVLASGEAYPRCEVEVLRADEAAEGIEATPNPEGRLVPRARATRIGLVARAWVVRGPNAERERDTGDLRVSEVVGVAADARAATFQETDARRAAGRQLGRLLGAKILGLPAPSGQ